MSCLNWKEYSHEIAESGQNVDLECRRPERAFAQVGCQPGDDDFRQYIHINPTSLTFHSLRFMASLVHIPHSTWSLDLLTEVFRFGTRNISLT